LVIDSSAESVDDTAVKALRRARQRWLSRRGDEAGFGLMELVVASTVMMTALTSMAWVTTSAFSDIAMAKERQTANALLDQAIEQLRALPYDTVSLGMRTSDLAGDPRIIGAGTAGSPYRLAATNERIVHVSTNQVIAPLVPNVSSRTLDNKVYVVRVYLTHFQDNPASGAVTATAYVDWRSAARNAGKAVSLRTSTVIFSPAAASAGSGGSGSTPTACLSTATHPFSGPCLEFFFGAASASGGAISITGDSVLSTVLGGTLTMGVPEASSTVLEEQTTTVQGRAKASSLNGAATSGGDQVTTKADNDPASDGSVGNDGPRSSGALAATASGSSGTTTMSTTATTDSTAAGASSVSTTAAADSHKCGNVAGTSFLNDGLPCGRSNAVLQSLASTLGLGTLGITGQTLGTIKPVTISGMTSTAHTDRQASATSGACVGTSSTGCIRSTATTSISSLTLGGIGGLNGVAAGAALIKLDNFKATVTAEAGINAAAPSASVTSGTLSIWNPTLLGGSFQTLGTVTLGSGSTITVPSITLTDLINPGLTLTVSAQLRTGSSTISSTPGTCMTTLACRTRADATMGSPLVGTITYRFQLGSNVVSMTITVDLGPLTASATYADPPSTA
jgi:hypothetical protein